MIFNSVTYLLFLSIVIPLYWVLPTQLRLWFVFGASLVFYGFWRFEFLAVMLLSATIDYFAAIAIDETPKNNKSRRRCLLAITLTLNLGLLFYFKYLFFITENINSVLDSLGTVGRIPLYRVILPFGISFYTFETVSYTVDVYRGIMKPERRFIHYALFVTFFPKLVAGPIQRASELICQLKTRTGFRLEFINLGVRRILFGLLIKVFLADNIGGMVDEGFLKDSNVLSAIDVMTLAFLFGFQIYFDFSAYSHIALGTAKLMGIEIPENFNFPFIACSLKDFWKRWHISLSAWIRDYLYLPLSGIHVINTSGKEGIGNSLGTPASARRKSALFLTWAIMGMWHGANWTFLIWGLYHATFIYLERLTCGIRWPLPNLIQRLVAHLLTLFIVMVGWIPFRCKDLNHTIAMCSKLFDYRHFASLGLHQNTYLAAALMLMFFYATYFTRTYAVPVYSKWPVISFVLNTAGLTVVILVVFTYLRPINQFIYFQF